MNYTKSVLSNLFDLLKTRFVPTDALREICILILWRDWQKHNNTEILSQSCESLANCYKKMANELEDYDYVVTEARLFDRIPEHEVKELIQQVATIDSSNQEIATALVELSQSIDGRSPSIFIEPGLGQEILELVTNSSANLSLYHDSSLIVLCQLEDASKANVFVSNINALSLTVTTLLGAKLIGSQPEMIFRPSQTLCTNVISLPPLGAQISTLEGRIRSEEGALERAMNEATDRAVVMVTQSTLLSRSAASLREQLVRKNWLQAVVTLPPGMLMHTSLPPVLIVINKHRQVDDRIALFEFQNHEFRAGSIPLAERVNELEVGMFGILVDAEQIRDNDFDLSFGRYQYGRATAILKKTEAQSLGAVAEIIRAQNIVSEDAHTSEEGIFLEAGARDIDEAGLLKTPEKRIRADESQLRRAEAQRLKPGDILLAVKGNIGRIALVPEHCGDNWIAGQLFVIIRPRSMVSSIYLYRYLSSQLIQAYLAEAATGAAMKIIKATDLQNIPVELPTAERLAEVEKNYADIQQEYLAIRQHHEVIQQRMSELWGYPD